MAREGLCGLVENEAHFGREANNSLMKSSQVKSIVTPRGNMKAARSVNHRDLPGGGGLWSSQVKIYSPGVHRAGRHMPQGLPAERAKAWVQAVLQQLEAVWDERTCAGAALSATFSLSSLRVFLLRSCLSRAARRGAVRGRQ